MARASRARNPFIIDHCANGHAIYKNWRSGRRRDVTLDNSVTL
jgi:hypothetical protein